MSHRYRLLAVGPALALALTALGACGSPEAEPQVASVPSKTAAVARAANKPKAAPSDKPISAAEYTVRFNTCMREEGFDLPDLKERDNVELDRDTRERLKAYKADPKFIAAGEKCSKRLPPVIEEKPAPLTAEQLAKQRDYAKCMRREGVPGFPDPEPLQRDPEPGEPQPPYGASNATWQRAFDKCYGIVDAQFVPGQGVG